MRLAGFGSSRKLSFDRPALCAAAQVGKDARDFRSVVLKDVEALIQQLDVALQPTGGGADLTCPMLWHRNGTPRRFLTEMRERNKLGDWLRGALPSWHEWPAAGPEMCWWLLVQQPNATSLKNQLDVRHTCRPRAGVQM